MNLSICRKRRHIPSQSGGETHIRVQSREQSGGAKIIELRTPPINQIKGVSILKGVRRRVGKIKQSGGG